MIYLLLLSLLVISIFAFSPGQYTPAFIVNHDKAAHAVVFFVLSFMMHRSFPAMPMQKNILVLGLLALTIEIVQFLFADRGFSVEDMGFNAMGISLYLFLDFVLRRWGIFSDTLQNISKD